MLSGPPFSVSGAHNVFLETIKRGEDDDFKNGTNTTIVLRLYEAFGGKLAHWQDFITDFGGSCFCQSALRPD